MVLEYKKQHLPLSKITHFCRFLYTSTMVCRWEGYVSPSASNGPKRCRTSQAKKPGASQSVLVFTGGHAHPITVTSGKNHLRTVLPGRWHWFNLQNYGIIMDFYGVTYTISGIMVYDWKIMMVFEWNVIMVYEWNMNGMIVGWLWKVITKLT